MLGVYIAIGVVVITFFWFVGGYNKFVTLSNKTKEAFSTMDVYLKKRWDLIPNLVNTVKGYAQHESQTLSTVVQLRNNSYDTMNNDEKIAKNELLTQGVSRLLAVAEGYPDLKANQNFLELQKQLTLNEDDIANARKYYNAVVNKFNIQIEMFPSNIIAGLFHFKQAKLYEAGANERNNVEVAI